MNIQLSEIKDAKLRGHTIDSLIDLLENKQLMFSTGRHWYVIVDDRNVCEFCGLPYRFGDTSNCERIN